MRKHRFGYGVLSLVALLICGCICLTLKHSFLSEDMRYILSVIVCSVEISLLAWSLYQSVIAVAGILPVKRPPSLRCSPLGEKFPKILCLTAAHNEEAVIANHIHSLKGLRYPHDRYDIVVLADNCTDDTANIALACGALVWKRTNTERRGKGHALKWALHEHGNIQRYDAVCFFDADNLVHPDFLQVMGAHIKQGHVAIQGYLDTKNPWDSWVTTAYASSYWYMNRFWQRARSILGLSATLCGTGFCIATNILRQVPWEATSLTEDLEYTARLLLKGHSVDWDNDAMVYDEKPVYYEDTVPQRQRWMQGFWTTAFRYSKPLLQTIVSGQAGWLRSLDLLIYTWQPVFLLLTGLNLIFSLDQWIFGMQWFHPWLIALLPTPVWETLGLVGIALPLTAFVLERAGWRTFLVFPLYLLFNVSWVPIAIDAIRNIGNKEWVHTKHYSKVRVDQMRGM